MRHAVIDSECTVVNVILCEPGFDPGADLSVVPCNGAFVCVGMKYVEGEFLTQEQALETQNDPENP